MFLEGEDSAVLRTVPTNPGRFPDPRRMPDGLDADEPARQTPP